MKTKTVIGAGIINLDLIIYKNNINPEELLIEEVGGTCGNVMCILAHLGWESYPIAVLDTSTEGYKIKKSLEDYGCKSNFVYNNDEGGTTIIKMMHKYGIDGSHKMTIKAGSPADPRFPKRHFLRKKDEVPTFIEQLDFIPNIFFFDDSSAGHRAIAEYLKSKGSLIYFEPSSIKDKKDLESIKISDIIKFSQENIPDVAFTENYDDKLFIQTLGKEGIRFKFKTNDWIILPGIYNDNVIDVAGAGDWTTAIFLNNLTYDHNLVCEDIMCALTEAQNIASKSISYMGSKGLIRKKD